MTYGDALAFLSALDRYGIKPGLARIRRLCALAGNPQDSFRPVLVAGTNGKGSTCAFLASVLNAAGLRVGTAPKPHLYSPRERLQVNGALCSEADFAALTGLIAPWIVAVAAEPAAGPPTYFEAMTLMAFVYFAESQVDWAVVEVGLGGRLDATNVLEPRASIITNIGLDHTDRLGSSLEAIASEKAGILRAGVPAITGAGGAALKTIQEHAASLDASLWRLGAELTTERIRLRPQGGSFDLHAPQAGWENLQINLAGRHQIENAALAAGVAVRLWEGGMPPIASALRRGLASARIPGRLEQLRAEPLLLIDAAHNPDGARSLVAALQELYLGPSGRRQLVLVAGLSETHQPEQMAQVLAPAASRIVCTASRHPQSVPAVRLEHMVRSVVGARVPIEVVEPVPAAVEAAMDGAAAQDVVCVTGSIFTIAEVPRPEFSAEGDRTYAP
jgi:dihydrofolate synthase/folylpolyglutamate synthase